MQKISETKNRTKKKGVVHTVCQQVFLPFTAYGNCKTGSPGEPAESAEMQMQQKAGAHPNFLLHLASACLVWSVGLP